jgi:hypothetical protein
MDAFFADRERAKYCIYLTILRASNSAMKKQPAPATHNGQKESQTWPRAV